LSQQQLTFTGSSGSNELLSMGFIDNFASEDLFDLGVHV